MSINKNLPSYRADRIIKDVADFLKIAFGNPGSIYRGQANKEWKLTPALSRIYKERKLDVDWLSLESEMLFSFKKYKHLHLDFSPKNTIEWLAIGQHYGLPTKLLDWSSNPLKALYFAVYDDAYFSQDGSLFSINPVTLIADDIGSNICCVYPSWRDARLIAQEGCFIAFPLPSTGDSFKPLDNFESYSKNDFLSLEKFTIPSLYKKWILAQLEILGVNHKLLFPDLDGLSKYIELKAKYPDMYLNTSMS